MIDLVIITQRDLAGLSRLGEHARLADEFSRAIVVSMEAVSPDVIQKNGGFHASTDH